MVCEKCEDKKVIFVGKLVQNCICVRKEQVCAKLKGKVAGEIKFKNPNDLLKFEDTTFIQISLRDFKDYLAGYLIHKRAYTFDTMTVSEYFDYRMNGGDNALIRRYDLFVLNFASVFFNKAAPFYVMQLCEERSLLGKKTWLISSVSKEELDLGFKESKDAFNEYLSRLPIIKYSKGTFRKAKTHMGRDVTDVKDLQRNWKSTI